MIFDIAFIVLLALFGISCSWYGAGIILTERDKSLEMETGRNLFYWAAVILFCMLVYMGVL